MTDCVATWLPDYSFVINRRSKRIHIKISPEKGLQVVIPHARAKSKAIEFLYTQKAWIEKHTHLLRNKADIVLPEAIKIRALNRVIPVRYQQTVNNSAIKLISKPNELVLYGDIGDEQQCRISLTRWVKRQAKQILIPWLQCLAVQHDFNLNNVTIRNQTTRWGSCSQDKNISLNYKLIFFPEPWAHYILIHELCHTVFFDHSAAFWSLVGEFVPEHKFIRKRLNESIEYIPNWLV